MRLLRAIARAIRLRIRTRATSVRAAPQARATTTSRGLVMSLKICIGSVFICALRLPVSPNAADDREQQRRRLPHAARDASSEPVIRPGQRGRQHDLLTRPASAARPAPARPRAGWRARAAARPRRSG